MNLKCLFGKHAWSGCKCQGCGLIRDEQHSWNGCRCDACGKQRNEEHSSNACLCKICYLARDVDHAWSEGKCTNCGKSRNSQKHTIEMNIAPLPLGADPIFVDSLECPGCKKSHTLEWENSGTQPGFDIVRSHCRECGDVVHVIIPGGLMGRF